MAVELLPRYSRRIDEINEAVTAAYLSGANTRRIRGALSPLLRDAPLSKSAVSRVIVTLKAAFEQWKQRPLEELDIAYVYLDAIALKVRSARKVVSMPVLAAVVVLTNGQKRLVSPGSVQQRVQGRLEGLHRADDRARHKGAVARGSRRRERRDRTT